LGLGLGLAATVWACTGDQPTAPQNSPPAADQLLGGGGRLGTGLGVRLLRCDSIPAAHAESVIGPEGGTLVIGPHRLEVPAGALDDTLTITADAPSDTVNGIKFEPQGLQFEAGHPARLTMSYANCPVLAQLLPKRIAYTTDLLQILDLLLSVDNTLLHRVSADVGHFSRYAIAW
jgi:hypothetical protein